MKHIKIRLESMIAACVLSSAVACYADGIWNSGTQELRLGSVTDDGEKISFKACFQEKLTVYEKPPWRVISRGDDCGIKISSAIEPVLGIKQNGARWTVMDAHQFRKFAPDYHGDTPSVRVLMKAKDHVAIYYDGGTFTVRR